MYLWITFAIEAGKKLPVVDAVIWALVPNEPHVWINIPIYECKDIKKDGDPKSIANSEFGVVKILVSVSVTLPCQYNIVVCTT